MTQKNPKTVLITGASSGIGLQLARLFASDGYSLVLVARDQSRLDAIAGELQTHFAISARVIPADLGEPDAAVSIVNRLTDMGIHIDILVNNAGTQVYAPFQNADPQALSRMLQVNITALMELTRLLLPDMVKAGSGRILNLGSTGSYVPGPLNAVYCASKAFVLSFSEAIAAELDGSGVTVTALCPGATRTDFVMRHGMQNVRLFKNAMPAEDVALIGYRALMKGRRAVVAGSANQFQILLFKLMGPFMPLISNRALKRMGEYFMGEVNA